MKNYVIALASILVLSACASTKSQVVTTTAEYKDDYHVVAEVCIPNHENKIVLNGRNAIRTELTNSSNPYALKLYAYTVDKMSIFRGNVGKVEGLTYVTFANKDNSSFLFKRDFSKYKINQWGAWEVADFLVKEGKESDKMFFWLATRDKDRTSELEKFSYPVSEDIRVRFKIMKFEDYLNTISIKDIPDIEKDVPRCM
jgi:hypothetical protein